MRSIWSDIASEDFQGNDEGEQTSLDETDMFWQDMALEGMPSSYTY